SRAVVLSALDAAERGAVIRTRTRCIKAERGVAWRLVLDVRGRRDVATARVLVNATGPWLKLFASAVLGEPTSVPARLDKGSHIVVRRLFEHDRAYIVQTHDRRVRLSTPLHRVLPMIRANDPRLSRQPSPIQGSLERNALRFG